MKDNWLTIPVQLGLLLVLFLSINSPIIKKTIVQAASVAGEQESAKSPPTDEKFSCVTDPKKGDSQKETCAAKKSDQTGKVIELTR